MKLTPYAEFLSKLQRAFLRDQEQTFFAVARELVSTLPPEGPDTAELIMREAADWAALLAARKVAESKQLNPYPVDRETDVADAYDQMNRLSLHDPIE